VSFSSRISPRTSTVIFFVRSPVATAVVTAAMLRTCAVRLPAIRLTASVRSFHVPATPFTFACPPSLPSVPTSRATRVTSDAAEPLQLLAHPLVLIDPVVEGVGDLAVHALQAHRKAQGEIAFAKRDQRFQQLRSRERAVGRRDRRFGAAVAHLQQVGDPRLL